MKIISRLLIVALVPTMMLFVACGGQETQQQQATPAPLVPSDGEQAARQAEEAARDMRATINRLVSENQQLTRQLHDMQARAMDHGSVLADLSQQASRMEGAVAAAVQSAGAEAAATAAAAPAERPAQRTSFSSFLLFIVFLLVALVVIYFIYRALKPRPFEDDDDDDFSSFDDDFGFDDEEDEDGDVGVKKTDEELK